MDDLNQKNGSPEVRSDTKEGKVDESLPSTSKKVSLDINEKRQSLDPPEHITTQPKTGRTIDQGIQVKPMATSVQTQARTKKRCCYWLQSLCFEDVISYD